MEEAQVQLKMLAFTADGKGFAFDLGELAAAAGSCPFLAYPGLPKGVKGVVQWGGKVFPVLDLWGVLGANFDVKAPADLDEQRMFVFTRAIIEGKFKEVAVPIPSDTYMIAPQEVLPAPKGSPKFVKGIVRDTEGHDATLVSISSLAQAV